MNGPNLFSPNGRSQTKFQELYDEAKLRKERYEKVKIEMLDKECTFKPHLVTKESKVSRSIIT
jgi:hypothetical protein